MNNANETLVANDTPVQNGAGLRAPEPVPGPIFQSVEKWDCRKSSALTAEEIRAITAFHGSFARGLARSLGLFLNTAVELESAGGREGSFGEILAAAPQGSLFATFCFDHQPLPVLVQVDNTLAASLLEFLLGGSGGQETARVELTDLDLKMLSEVCRRVGEELQGAWRDLNLHLRPEMTVERDGRRLLPATTGVLALTFGVKLASCAGALTLLLGASIVDRVLHAMDSSAAPPAPAAASTIGSECRHLLGEIPIQVSLELPDFRIPVRDLTHLAPDSVLSLPIAVNQPAKLMIAGRAAFSALPVRNGASRAARLNSELEEDREKPTFL